MTRPPFPHRYPSRPSLSQRRMVCGCTFATAAACTTVRSLGSGMRLDNLRIVEHNVVRKP